MNMTIEIRRSALFKAPVLIALVLILTSCGFWLVPFRKEEVKSFALRSSEFGEAFDLSVKAANDIHFNVEFKKKRAGTFEGRRGFGIDEISILYFHLQRGYKRKLYFTVRVKSSKNSAVIMKKFISSIDKYLDILPMMPEDLP
jgi:hypothetical protein